MDTLYALFVDGKENGGGGAIKINLAFDGLLFTIPACANDYFAWGFMMMDQ